MQILIMIEEVKKYLFYAFTTIVVALIGLFSIYFFGDDNKVEEAAEDYIEYITGVEIELSNEVKNESK